ncbi:acyl-CoA dehydrogenase family protein [Actinacidiphila sp. ITFR-21]|uniref:acyl-CoA dehydrogenase family protein n=1 Tax=Actinacidiphila sp. ITFR-21 TaxID=3075199 RepID=UPI00288AA171|nr:acyl-CoA dehydrogenase family protein [Streptomyces sp. ITFR-21]WNI19000.1 acyl-CoA dehydrogenase family protein [Streptomyces sp. ITFR-21]
MTEPHPLTTHGARPRGESTTLFNVRLPGDDDPRRQAVRRWLQEHPRPSGPELLDAGYMVPHWPRPWGIDASGGHVLVIDEELRRAGVTRPDFPLSRGYVGPLVLEVGTPAQIDRYLRPMLTGEEVWCQLFSEPEAGSDLASLTTRAERDGTDYVVNGTKIWTTHGHLSQYGLLLARTSAEGAKHQGISVFICPMDHPAVTLHPIHNMEGEHKWNMVYFNDLRLPAENLLGVENDGWPMARRVLANERMQMSSLDGLAWGHGPSYTDLLRYARAAYGGKPLPDDLRQRITDGYTQALSLHVMRVQALGRVGYRPETGVVPEVRRTLADDHGQRMLELWRDLHGAAGVVLAPGDDPAGLPFAENYFYARALTIGGGTAQIQRNVLAERVLGMPRG